MRPTDLSLPASIALGVAAGAMSGLFGVGGGTVLVPGLVVLTALTQHQVHATSLAAIIVTAPAAMTPFAVGGDVSWAAAVPLVLGAQLGVVGGAKVMHRIPDRQLRIAFAIFMLLVAVRLALPGAGDPQVDQQLSAGAEGAAGGLAGGLLAGAAGDLGGPSGLALLAAIGVVTGLLSAVLGVGGGVVMVPAMVLLAGFDQHLAEGTSLLVIIPTALVGAWRHHRNGYTVWRLGMTIGAGGVVGGLAGGAAAQLLPADVLQVGFAGLLVLAATRLLRRSGNAGDPPVEDRRAAERP